MAILTRLIVNRLCLIGVSIGFISLLGYWTSRLHYEFFDWQYYAHVDFVIAPLLFTLGLLLAIVTPLGGVLQAIDIIYFALENRTFVINPIGIPIDPQPSNEFTIFFYLGLTSTILILMSLRIPTWISRDDGSFPRPRDKGFLFSRLLTFSITKENEQLELPVSD